MFGILKKKITGLVNTITNTITKSISGEKEEKKSEEISESKKTEEVSTFETTQKTIEIKQEKPVPIPEQGVEIEDKNISKEDAITIHTEKQIKKEEGEKKVEKLQKESIGLEKGEIKEEMKKEKPLQSELKEAEIKVKTSFLTKVKSIITPEVTIKESDVKTALEDFEMQLLTADVALPVAE
ncbi:MAG: hypothetical protein QXK21_02600, partial [Candidatus Micrarchaeia archaeon]